MRNLSEQYEPAPETEVKPALQHEVATGATTTTSGQDVVAPEETSAKTPGPSGVTELLNSRAQDQVEDVLNGPRIALVVSPTGIADCPQSQESEKLLKDASVPCPAALAQALHKPEDITDDHLDAARQEVAWPSQNHADAADFRARLARREEIAGDYIWKSGDGESESRIKIRSGGKWWHAAHRISRERGVVVTKDTQGQGRTLMNEQVKSALCRDDGREKAAGDKAAALEFSEVAIWEMAECLGSWCVVEDMDPDHMTLALTFEHCRWTSDHPMAPLRMRPTAQGRAELDEHVDQGRLMLNFTLRQGAIDAEVGAGHWLLELQTSTESIRTAQEHDGPPKRHALLRNVQAAVQTLGFVRSYARPPQHEP